MHILAIDPSSTPGWARRAPGMHEPVWGRHRCEGRTMGLRFQSFHNWLLLKVKALEVDLIAYEQAFWSPKKVTTEAAERWRLWAEGCIHEVGAETTVEVLAVPTAAWRKHLIGVSFAPRGLGKADRRKWLKQMVIGACAARGWRVRSDDEADALGVLDCVWCDKNPRYGATSGPLFRGAL